MMSKSLLHGRTIKLFGPPGTGKTYQLLNRIKYFLKKGVQPNRIAYFSFTNKAVDETIDRLKTINQNYDEDTFPYFSTIHSFARQQFAEIPVLDPNEDMFQFHSDYGTIKIRAVKGFEEQKILNNWSLRVYDKARNMKQDPIDAYKQQQRKEVRLPQFISIISAYESFKNYESEPGVFKQDKLDFTDMIKKFIDDGIVPDLEVLMVDEAQDLTPLQWDLISKLAKQTKIVYLAGDDDQAIYEWNGADVDFFIHFPGKHKILKKSRRIPKTVHMFSKLLMAPAKGYRVEKIFEPKDDEGTVTTYPDIKKITFNNKETYMILTRIRDVKGEVEKDLKAMGVYYQDVQGVKSFKVEQWQAINSWSKIMNGGSITREEACIMYHYIQKIDHGFRSADSSKWSFAHENQPFNYDELQLRCGLREDKGTWQDMFRIRFSNKEKEYFIKCINNGFNLDFKSNIIVDTMHAVKGGEADNVILLSKANWPSHYERKNLSEKIKECRVWYVGATRAKKNLHLVNTHHKYHFPLGSIYNIYRRNYEHYKG